MVGSLLGVLVWIVGVIVRVRRLRRVWNLLQAISDTVILVDFCLIKIGWLICYYWTLILHYRLTPLHEYFPEHYSIGIWMSAPTASPSSVYYSWCHIKDSSIGCKLTNCTWLPVNNLPRLKFLLILWYTCSPRIWKGLTTWTGWWCCGGWLRLRLGLRLGEV